ncbi:actin-like ATPase domain-containing protein [Lophiostoma macrostomum CBS 122681]|uniref:Actin-like ATPase domain-containing protein n=1 Tax=Lophiostoma macrostomum CBS 122681 TaxID=1314788 RepID=A0A6A6T5M2_9PLEO|nr:actin-like ATPase domain-containing protein [Lophiostoma macrostomum CBS 122681]
MDHNLDQNTKDRLLAALGKVNLQDDDDSDRMVVALDFGTTYSGVAYAFSSKPDEVHCIKEWPGSSKSVSKCPTVIKYTNRHEFKWGYELDRTSEEKIVGIKLLLDPDQKRPLFDTAGAAATKAEIAKLGKPPVDIASDYISAIYNHALRVIAGKVPKAYLDMLDKYFVLSVPAVWSDKAKDTTLRAARNAGMSPIELIKEPEAAALYTLNYLKKQGLEVGDAITICDAGGGTVDLVSYEIVSLNPLELKELCPPTGGIAGSMMINKRFENWVKDMVGERAFFDLKEHDAYRRAMKDFDENIKPGFRGKDDDVSYVNFPMANIKDNKARGITGNTLPLSADDMHEICQPVFEEIDKLVKHQVNEVRLKRMDEGHPKGAAIKAIFLVGGFGESAFLKASLDATHKNIQIIQPNGAWEAIVKGAALSKLPEQVTVVSSVAERHYGVMSRSVYREDQDAGRQKHYDSHEGVYRVDRMTWFINKHDDMQRDRAIAFPFYRTFDINMDADDYVIHEDLHMCSTDDSPVYPISSVSLNCKLRVDLRSVPRDQFKTVTGVSGTHYKLNYKLLVKIEGARMAFAFECAGKEYASVEAMFER